jgi:NAD(P)H-dependent FMN reductase
MWGKEWQAKPAAFISDGATNGSRSVSQIRAITSSFDMLDPNAVLAIRDMLNLRNSKVLKQMNLKCKHWHLC